MSSKNLSISNNEKLSLFSTLSTMINAGIPILEAIDSILEDSKGNTKKVVQAIRDDLIQGKSLSSAFSRFPTVFDKVTINVIKASEEAGTLEVVLKDLKTQLQKDMVFMDNVKSAITYPIIILILFLVVLTVILVAVIPKIATVFTSLRVKLPLPTQILIFMSNVILHYTIPFIGGIIIIFGGLMVLYRFKRSMVLGLIFSLPMISNLIRQIDLVRFSRAMFLLLNSGITITAALTLAQEIVIRKDIAKVISISQETVLSGKKLSEAFKDKKTIFPGIVIKIIEAGEKTGTLDKSMEEIAEYMDYQVNSTLKTVISLLEPLMLVFVGLLVGGMMMSIIGPIYGLISQVGGGR
ncbi:MAG TPA: type II secretion system F family protein [Candidatus Sulfotelmatobacter sp.]|nr:type II secretion system F family protein [Candidatus Sulfotelmatobacter sp.]